MRSHYLSQRYAKRPVDRLETEPETLIRRNRRGDAIRSQLAHYRARSSFEHAWRAPDWVMKLRYLDLFEVLRRIDEDAFVAMLDALPHPSLVRQCLHSQTLHTDMRALARLLERLSPSLDSQGKWRVSGHAATVVLCLATSYLLAERTPRTFDGPPPDLQSWENAALEEECKNAQELCRTIADALFSRQDAQHLGWLWLTEVLGYPAPTGRQAQRTRIVNAPLLLAQTIIGRLQPRQDELAWVREPSALYRPHCVLAVLWVGAKGADFDQAAFEFLTTALVRDSGQNLANVANLIENQDSVFSRGLGSALERIPDFAGWLLRCWRAMRFQRECAWRSGPDAEHANPAEVITCPYEPPQKPRPRPA